MTLTRRDIEDAPVFDTPLHPTIELLGGEVGDYFVIHHPDRYKQTTEWIESTAFVDTYNWR